MTCAEPRLVDQVGSGQWIRARPSDVIDLFVYVVVLNLAIEYTLRSSARASPSRC